MSQYMLLVYEEEVEGAAEAEREAQIPGMLELHRSLREAGRLLAVRSLRSTDSATSVRVRQGETEITDGPFAVTKEVLAGYYVVECADLDEALRLTAELPQTRWGTIEVRPVTSGEKWLEMARRQGLDLPDEAAGELP